MDRSDYLTDPNTVTSQLLQALEDRRPKWHKHAACSRGGLGGLFFSKYKAEQDRAKEICASCSVRQLCYAEGTLNGEIGIWGGVVLKPVISNSNMQRHK